MKLRAIPDPVLGPYPRRHKADLKPLVKISIPKPAAQAPPAQVSGNKPGNNPETNPEIPKGKKQALPPPPPGSIILGKAEDGTEIPAPFKPIDPLTALASPNPTVALVMMRQLQDMRGPMPDTSTGALAVMDKLETTLRNGQDVTTLNDEISTLILGDEEHNELIRRLSNSLDRQRAIEIFKSRSKFEDFCHACMRRGDLSIVEGMALMAYWNTQLSTIFSRMDKKGTKAEGSQEREALDLVERVNRPTLLQNKELQRKFDEAPPQEREILRKIGFKLENALAARITKTTETQTVEIIQNGPQPKV